MKLRIDHPEDTLLHLLRIEFSEQLGEAREMSGVSPTDDLAQLGTDHSFASSMATPTLVSGRCSRCANQLSTYSLASRSP